MNGDGIDDLIIGAFSIGESYIVFGVACFTLPGDYNSDDEVDGADFLTWQRGFGTTNDAHGLSEWEAGYGDAPSQPGDFDRNEVIDGSDFLKWQRNYGTCYDGDDLADWQAAYGGGAALAAASSAVPEPSTFALIAVALLGVSCHRRM